jgi:hypothetical protein
MFMRPVSRRRFAALALSAAGALAVLTAVPRVSAQAGAPKVEIMVLHATQDPKGGHIDPQVAKMPQLTQPPFSAYNSYALIDKKVVPLDVAKAADPGKGKPSAPYTLVNGRVLQITLLDQLPDKRYHVAAEINQPGGQAFLKLLEVKAAANEPFFVAGQSYKNGILVIGITVRP